jgi:hypothetical protein
MRADRMVKGEFLRYNAEKRVRNKEIMKHKEVYLLYGYDIFYSCLAGVTRKHMPTNEIMLPNEISTE